MKPIKAERLTVTPFTEGHLTDRYVSWLNDQEIVRYSEQRHRPHTLESCHAYFESFRDGADCFLAIIADDPDLGHIGNISVTIDEPNAVADVAIMIGEKQTWNGGYGSEAWNAVVQALLSDLGMRKVTAGTMSVNLPMLRLFAKADMEVEGCREKQFLWEGGETDLIYVAAYGQ